MPDSPPPPPPLPTLSPRKPFPRTVSLISGTIVGVLYGLLFRASTQWMHVSVQNDSVEVMTVSFLALGSLVIGLLTVWVAERAARRSFGLWIVIPWPAIMLVCAISILFRIEGFICVVFALPVGFFFSSIGGLIAGLIARKTHARPGTIACVAVLPFLLAPAETCLHGPVETRTVSSEIRIHAPAVTIWRNIERVPAIAPAELRPTWAHRIGFPRPVEATLSYEGVGGVRHATFEHGLRFIETVTAWEPEHRLAFGIRADTAHIPPTTLDQHVTIGGRYFDVLDGEYRLEPLPNGDTLLHLTSHQRLSTDFNGYAGLWSDAVMQNLQTSILEVIQHRCERE
jgi:hypothetical protein